MLFICGALDQLRSMRAGCTGAIRIYEHADFKGKSILAKKGAYRSTSLAKVSYSDGTVGFNDKASSLRVPVGCTAILYEHGNFDGNSAVFPPGYYNAADIIRKGMKDDATSSIEVVEGLGGA